jgi:hypothetical protein
VKVAYLADADLSNTIVNGVLRREPSVDFLRAHRAGLRGMPDLHVLELAAAQGRILVSHDVGTMPAHFHRFRESGRNSPGVFLIPQILDVATAIDELLLVWLVSELSEWENRLVWFPF